MTTPGRSAPRSLPAPARRVLADFQARHGMLPEYLVRAPGRVNLIGEHTDYNDGFVLPLAIDRAAWIACSAILAPEVQVRALDLGAEAAFPLAHFAKGGPAWVEYLRGPAWALQEAGYPVVGWTGSLASDVPLGAGLSSSAALELATLRAFAATAGFAWDAPRMAALGQRAENAWVGVNCGIMDQMISATGVAGHAVLIDCRSLALAPVPLPRDHVVVVMDTATRRGLVDSAYNERRAQCEAAATHLKVGALRDVSPARLATEGDALEAVTRRRARHVVTENQRTLAAADALRHGDARAVGRLLDLSHESLRDDFAVSSEALDLIVRIGRDAVGCVGARMTGAGFGGCAVALVEAAHAEEFVATVQRGYADASGRDPALYVTTAHPGASVMTRAEVEALGD